MTLRLATKFSPTPEAFSRARTAGFHNAELYLDDSLLEDWQRIAAWATDSGLKLALHFPNRGPLSEASLVHCVELYRSVEASALVIHQPMIDVYGERLLKADSNLRLAVENHRLSPERFQAWANDNRWLTLDVEHFWKFTHEDAPLERMLRLLEEFLVGYSDKLAHVHLPGYSPGRDEHRPMYCGREMVWEVWTLLAKFRFQGLMVSEVDPRYQHPIDLRMDCLLFERWKEEHAGS